MKAIVYSEYGTADVLRLKEVEKPTPKEKEVLVRIRAASVNALDWRLVEGKPFLVRIMMGGLRRPKGEARLGVDLAGEVEAVGSKVTQFKPGDAVFGAGEGTFAEYACVPEEKLTNKPANVSFEDASTIGVAGFTALQGLRDSGRIQRGQKVLIEGASGGVGTFAVQIAKLFGAEVTAVCSTRNVESARALGADHVIDYTTEDFTNRGKLYDLILGANSYHPILDYRRVLTPNGIYVGVGGGGSGADMLKTLFLAPLVSLTGSRKMKLMLAKLNKPDLEFFRDRLADGSIKPVIVRRYPLADAAEAVRYVEEGHAQGKAVVTM